MADNDADKWARAQALVDEEDELRAQYEDYRHVQALDSRFGHCGRRRVYEMFKGMVKAFSGTRMSSSNLSTNS